MVIETVNAFRVWFWNEDIWLPPNTTWETFKSKQNGINYAQFNDLYYAAITSLILIVIRLTLERYIYTPMGLYFGLKAERKKRASSNPVLEKVVRTCKGKITYKQIQGLAKQLDWSERQVQRWLRLKFSENKPTTLTKFTESAWRCSFYSFAFAYGLYTLWDKPWMWESVHCYVDYPHHSVSNEEWFYYNFELGFYLSLIVSQFFDIQRKDFWQMFIHHIVTVMLLCFSWACNLQRIGTLVLVIHDFADIPLEGAKLSRYVRSANVSNVIFATFTVCWIYSRLGLLPYRVISYSLYFALDIVPMFPAYYIFNALLCALQVLHIIWTWLILRIAHNAIFNDGVKDLRESDDTTVDEASSSDESRERNKAQANGHISGPAESTSQVNGNNNEMKLS
ncbi:ceramide synthase 6-like protein [Leptotrombidium deliense]|uniref:Ceramide synthase 6-like protein n=1 Tax=Leptotrombidium deliense TaxID=299467 RepID=A0A443SF93_9ACAR|nr:ceramide synthase 6-like protein [Leptotrombidium deliense]